jgi:predicted nucleic acid-binding protein
MVAWAYFDTSVLLKRYVREAGSGRAMALFRRYRLLSSAVAPVETVSALRLRELTGDLKAREVAAAIGRMATERARWELIGATSLVLSRAEELVRAHALRPLDAIHLASALIFQAETGRRLRFLTAEARQRAAGLRLYLDVVWVG